MQRDMALKSVADPKDRAVRGGANGVRDAINTSPDLGGQNVYSTRQAADTNGIRESFLSLD